MQIQGFSRRFKVFKVFKEIVPEIQGFQGEWETWIRGRLN